MQTLTREQIEAAHRLGEALLHFAKALHPSVETPRPATPHAGQAAPDALPIEKLLVSAREAASLLSVSDRTLWTLTAPRGPIPSVRLGRCVRYSIGALRGWAQRCEE